MARARHLYLSGMRSNFFTAALMLAALSAFSQDQGYFNQARTRCFAGGIAFSTDNKTIYHAELIKPDSLQPPRYVIAQSSWRNGAWSSPSVLGLTASGQELSPVLSPDGQRLYFSSTAPAPGKQTPGDLNIWYADCNGQGWSQPVFLSTINSDAADRFTAADSDGNFYLVSGRNGNQEIYTTSLKDGQWSAPQPIAAWNSPQDEEYISIHDALGIAFIQRTNPGVKTEILYSLKNNPGWSEPKPLDYDGKCTAPPYVQRSPMLSQDGGTFYLTAQSLIWQQSAASLFKRNNISLRAPKHRPLPSRPLQKDEPEVFGGLKLKTNNGISFTPDMKTIYVSRYTAERDSSRNQFIKIFESTLSNGSWSDFTMSSFCKRQVPFEYHPSLAPGGKRLFFNSRAPLPGSGKVYLRKNNLWYANRVENGWSDPVLVAAVATDDYDDYASVARNGNLYFRSDRAGGSGSGDIYMSRFRDGNYEAPVNLSALNSADNENDVCIDPEERFIIFNRYYDRTREIRLFVSVRNDGDWSAPRLLRGVNRTEDWELTPTLSPDGKYFYYEVNSNIFRVKTEELFHEVERKLMRS